MKYIVIACALATGCAMFGTAEKGEVEGWTGDIGHCHAAAALASVNETSPDVNVKNQAARKAYASCMHEAGLK